MNRQKKFTLVSTVFNEGKRLSQTIQDLERQSIIPDEIVITDAGSTDGTFEYLKDWKLKSKIKIHILQKDRCNVAEGRNHAIQHAQNEIIVSTDFGCRFHPDWLKSLTDPFLNSEVFVVGGAYSVIEEEIITEAAKANFILTNGYKINIDDSFIPSSRSIAYYKSVWKDVGGYCEWLTLAADDLVFGKSLKAKGYQFHLVRKPYVYWMRHEKASSYAKEAFRYGLGDGEAKVNLRNSLVVLFEIICRYTFIPLIILLIVLALLFSPLVFFLILPMAFGFRPYIKAFNNWRNLHSSKYSFITFIKALGLIELTRINYLKGYFKGYISANPKQKEGVKKLKLLLS